jgi:hypothetical protein
MPKKRMSIADKMNRSRVLINNVIDDETIKSALLEYGYDKNRINEGKTMYEECQQLIQEKNRMYRQQYHATVKLRKIGKETYSLYMDLFKLAKRALKDNEGLSERLGVEARLGISDRGWITQARAFYNIAMNDQEILPNLAKFNITPEKLQQGSNLLTEVEKLDDIQEKSKGKAQEATSKRNQTLKKLWSWVSDLTEVCKIAFKSNPQILEQLGIPARS